MKESLFIGATHGNEGFSIPALERLSIQYPLGQYGYNWIVGNPEALAQNIRFTDVDLNRCAPGNPESTKYEERRAAEIIRLSSDCGFVIDIHGSPSDCGVCTIVTSPTVQNLALAASLGCENNVIWNNPQSATRGPLTQHVLCPAVELECGPQDSADIQEELFNILERFIANGQNTDISSLSTGNWYQVVKQATCPPESSDFTPFRSDTGEVVIPFLCNAYESGTCVTLEPLVFTELFTSNI